jgi:hypothetical protein
MEATRVIDIVDEEIISRDMATKHEILEDEVLVAQVILEEEVILSDVVILEIEEITAVAFRMAELHKRIIMVAEVHPRGTILLLSALP